MQLDYSGTSDPVLVETVTLQYQFRGPINPSLDAKIDFLEVYAAAQTSENTAPRPDAIASTILCHLSDQVLQQFTDFFNK